MTSAGNSSGVSYDHVVSAITTVSGDRIQQGQGYIKVCCPAHDDRHPSCEIRYLQDKGKTRVHCYVCDDDEAVLRAAGLTFADLYDEPRSPASDAERPQRSASAPKPARTPPSSPEKTTPSASRTSITDDRWSHVCDYLYPRADGSRCGKVRRYHQLDAAGQRLDKSFRQQRFNSETRRWEAGGFDPVLYRAPEVARAITVGRPVYLTEGEEDADTAVAMDLVGTTNAGGAKNVTAEHAEQLRGAHVVQVVDRDVVGMLRAVAVRELLRADDDPVAASLRTVEPADGKDLTDHYSTGHTTEHLVEIDPTVRAIELMPTEVSAALAATPPKPQHARQLIRHGRTVLAHVEDPSEHARLAAMLDDTEALLGDGPADELSQRRHQRRDQQTSPAGHEDEDPEPHWPLSISSGRWAYSTGEDGLARGVYKFDFGAWRKMSDLPHVLERLVRRDGEGRPTGHLYRIAMRPLVEHDEVVICSDGELKDGSWADQLDVPLSADDKIIKAAATAIRQCAHALDHRTEITPRWSAGQMHMPPTDVLGSDYGNVYGHEHDARDHWQRIAAVIARNPKVALACAAAVAGLFVRPLLPERRSFWLHLHGRGQAGKTTTLSLAAGLFGMPTDAGDGGIVETFDASGKGTLYRFGELSCLPIFLDEIGSGEIRSHEQREKMILTVAEGASRRVATRTQGTRSSPPWHGTVICSGNDSLLDGITNEAVYARTIEVPAPITESPAEHSELAALLPPYSPPYWGWPLRWLRSDMNLDRLRKAITAAADQMHVAEGGVEKTAAMNLAFTVAAAEELDRALGTAVLRDATLQAAREVLRRLLDELAERSGTPHERVHNAVLHALMARPAAFPTLSEYRSAVDGDGLARPQIAREVEGWLLTDSPDLDGDIAILPAALPEITRAAGITDSRTGLRELADAGVLLRSGESSGKLQRRLRVHPGPPPRRVYVYVFRLDTDALAELQSPDPDPSLTDSSPVPDSVPDSEPHTGDTCISAMTRTDDADQHPQDGSVPDVPDSMHKVAREAREEREGRDHPRAHWLTDDGPNGAVYLDATGGFDRCRHCGDLTRCFDRDGWIHHQCATRERPTHEGVTDQAPPTPAELEPGSPNTPDVVPNRADGQITLAGPVPTAPTGYAAACAVLDPTGTYLPDGTFHPIDRITDALDILTIGEQLQIGHPGGPGQLILTDAMCVELGLVAVADNGIAGDEARSQIRERLGALDQRFADRARAAGWEIDSLRVENRARRPHDNRVFDIVLTPYEHLWSRGREDAHPLGVIDPHETLTQQQYAAEAARMMGYLAQLLGVPWRSSAIQVGWDLFDRAQRSRSRRRGHVLTRPARLPELTGDVTADGLVPQWTWSRWSKAHPASDREREQLQELRYAVHLDRKAAWLASSAKATIGYLTDDEPEMRHYTRAESVGALLAQPERIPAGLFRLRLPACLPGVPPLHPNQSPTESRWIWMPAPLAAAARYDDDPSGNMIGLGCDVEELVAPDDERQAEAWLFPAQGRLLEGLWYDTLRDARYAVDQEDDEVAATLIKRVYSGMLQTTQNTAQSVLDGPRAWHHQGTLLPTVKAGHYAWQHHLLRRAHYAGLWVASAQIDEVVVLVSDVDDAVLGTMSGRVGQYKRRLVRELTDEHRDQLARGVPAHELQGGELQ